MLLIGENINIMNTKLHEAMKNRDKGPIQQIAAESVNNGIDYLDINIGPARKDGPELIKWIIGAVREVCNLPLSIDTTNTEAIKAGLSAENKNTLINSIQATETRMGLLLPLMKEHECAAIGLLVGESGMPRDENERGAIAAEFSVKVDELEIAHEKIYLDPIVLPVRFQQEQVISLLEFMKMFKDLFPGFKTTCGLSNVSNGAPEELRPLINRTYLVMLMTYGLDSAIVDAYDTELIALAKGKNENIASLIKKSMEEEMPEKSLTREESRYVKTVKILQGKSIYSDSWLKL